MADVSKIFKPRRGTKSIMAGTKKSTVLASGEMFVEVPDAGVGKGASKIKIGDGTTAYSSLPYALGDTSNDKITFSSNTSTTVAAALNSVTSGGSLKNIVAGLKQAISLCNTSITQLNDDFSAFNSAKSIIVSSALGKALSMTTSTKIADVATKINGVTNRGAWTSSPTTATKVTIPAGYHNGSGYVDTSGIKKIVPAENIINLGNITITKTIDITSYTSNYASLSVSNFIGAYTLSVTAQCTDQGNVNGTLKRTLSYNASTGKLTVTCNYKTAAVHGSNHLFVNTGSCSTPIYLIC